MRGELIAQARVMNGRGRSRAAAGMLDLPDELVTITQAAGLMGISRSTVEYLIKRGDLTALRLPPQGRTKGRKIYLRRSEVLRVRDTWRRRPPRQGEA